MTRPKPKRDSKSAEGRRKVLRDLSVCGVAWERGKGKGDATTRLYVIAKAGRGWLSPKADRCRGRRHKGEMAAFVCAELRRCSRDSAPRKATAPSVHQKAKPCMWVQGHRQGGPRPRLTPSTNQSRELRKGEAGQAQTTHSRPSVQTPLMTCRRIPQRDRPNG